MSKHPLALLPTAASALLLIALATAPAQAQQRLFLDQTLDLDHYEAVARARWGDDPLSWRLQATVGGLTTLDPQGEQTSGGQAGARVVMGLTGRGDQHLRLDSQLLAPLSTSDEGNDQGWQALTGRHTLAGRYALSQTSEGEHSFELSLRAGLDHGADPAIFSDPTLGTVGFYDRRASGTLGWRRGINSGGAWTWPVTYALRQVAWPSRPGEGFTTHTLSTGIGATDTHLDTLDGWFEAVGVSWSRTFFEPTPCCQALDPKAPVPTGDLVINQLDLRLANLDRVIALLDDEVLFGGGFFLGGSWLWGPASDVAMLTGGAHVALRFIDGDDVVDFRLASTRRGNHSPDGGRLLADHRIEVHLGYEERDLGVAFHHRAFVNLTADATQEHRRDHDIAARAALHSEWSVALGDFDLGAWHQARLAAAPGDTFDPMAQERRWSHELGLFLRYDLEDRAPHQLPAYEPTPPYESPRYEDPQW